MAKVAEFLTVQQAAEFLGVAPNTLRNWDRQGKIPVYRHPLNGYRLFKRQDLQLVLEQIDQSGTYPSGWPRPAAPRRKPR